MSSKIRNDHLISIGGIEMLEMVTAILGVVAAFCQAWGFVWYNIQIFQGKSLPKSATWMVWAFLATLHALSYNQFSNVVLAIQYYTGAAGCLGTFLFAVYTRKLAWPNRKDLVIIGLGILSSLVWWKFRHAGHANLIVLLAFAISLKPTLDGVIKNARSEKPGPWIVWTVGFAVGTINALLLMLLDESAWRTIVNPVFFALVHGLVAALCREKRRQTVVI